VLKRADKDKDILLSLMKIMKATKDEDGLRMKNLNAMFQYYAMHV